MSSETALGIAIGSGVVYMGAVTTDHMAVGVIAFVVCCVSLIYSVWEGSK